MLGEKKKKKSRARAGTKDRGQRVRMYGHRLGNVTERVRKSERDGKQTGSIFFSSQCH